MFVNGDISIVIYLHVASFGRDTDDPIVLFLSHILTAQLDHLHDTRPGVSTQPRHPAFGGSGLWVLALSAFNGKRGFEDRGPFALKKILLASNLLSASLDPCVFRWIGGKPAALLAPLEHGSKRSKVRVVERLGLEAGCAQFIAPRLNSFGRDTVEIITTKPLLEPEDNGPPPLCVSWTNSSG